MNITLDILSCIPTDSLKYTEKDQLGFDNLYRPSTRKYKHYMNVFDAIKHTHELPKE